MAQAPPPLYPEMPGPAGKPPGKGLAVTSLVLGILGPCTVGLGSLVGIILGIVALVKISKGAATGKGLAVAGIVVSGLGIVLLPTLGLLAALLMPAVSSARGEAYRAVFLSSMKQLYVATATYAVENDGRLPSADAWPKELGEYVGGNIDEMTAAPSDRDAGRAVAINAALAGRGVAEIQNPSRTVLFYECAPGAPTAGGPDLLPPEPRYQRGYVIAFVDGHVETVRPERVGDLVWTSSPWAPNP